MDMFSYVCHGVNYHHQYMYYYVAECVYNDHKRENCTRFCSRKIGETPLLSHCWFEGSSYEQRLNILWTSHHYMVAITFRHCWHNFTQQTVLSSPLRSTSVEVRDGSYHTRALAWLRKAEASYCLNTHCKIYLHNSDSGAVWK